MKRLFIDIRIDTGVPRGMWPSNCCTVQMTVATIRPRSTGSMLTSAAMVRSGPTQVLPNVLEVVACHVQEHGEHETGVRGTGSFDARFDNFTVHAGLCIDAPPPGLSPSNPIYFANGEIKPAASIAGIENIARLPGFSTLPTLLGDDM